MKKLVVALVAALVLSVAAPAAAAGVEFSGSLESKVEWNQQTWTDDDGGNHPQGFSAKSSLDLGLGLNAGGGQGVQAVIELAPWELEGDQAFGPQQGFGTSAATLKVNKAYIQTTGALWHGGPALTTRIGNLDVAYSEYLATLINEGLSVDGIAVGPVALGGFMAWDGDQVAENQWSTFTSVGATARAQLPGAELTATAVRAGEALAYGITAGIEPMPGIRVDGAFAQDAANQAQVIRVDASVQPVSNLTVKAGYRNVDQNYDPRYVKRTFDSNNNRTDWVGTHLGDAGFNVGLETLQGPVTIAAGYDQPDDQAHLNLSTAISGFELGTENKFKIANGFSREESVLSVKRPVEMPGMSITPAYKATVAADNAITHELTAEGTLNLVPQLPNLGIEAGLKLAGGQLSYNAGATYQAPNGLKIHSGYDSAHGATVDAGISVAF